VDEPSDLGSRTEQPVVDRMPNLGIGYNSKSVIQALSPLKTLVVC
jgi:hypothetical protein